MAAETKDLFFEDWIRGLGKLDVVDERTGQAGIGTSKPSKNGEDGMDGIGQGYQ